MNRMHKSTALMHHVQEMYDEVLRKASSLCTRIVQSSMLADSCNDICLEAVSEDLIHTLLALRPRKLEKKSNPSVFMVVSISRPITCRNVGMIEVTVLKAQDLDKEDWLGKSDPLVEVWTQHTHVEATVSFLF